jgi:HAMP domain-containing protein
MKRIRRLLKLAATAFGALLYVWYAAVRLAPGVKRRKRAKRS